jgi:hypothetical protein
MRLLYSYDCIQRCLGLDLALPVYTHTTNDLALPVYMHNTKLRVCLNQYTLRSWQSNLIAFDNLESNVLLRIPLDCCGNSRFLAVGSPLDYVFFNDDSFIDHLILDGRW